MQTFVKNESYLRKSLAVLGTRSRAGNRYKFFFLWNLQMSNWRDDAASNDDLRKAFDALLLKDPFQT